MMRYALASLLVTLLLVLPAAGQTMYSEAAASGLGFGGAVAVGEQALFVGSAPVGWPRGEEPAGTVYRYERDSNGAWVEAARMQASNATFGDTFGRSLAIQDGLLVVGAPGAQAAYVFEQDETGAWKETDTLTPSSLVEGAEFGGAYERGGYRTGSIAIADDRIAVASYGNGTGAVHVFSKDGMAWKEEAVLTTEADDEGFGWSIAAWRNQVLVGANRADEQKGAVYVFTRNDAGVWEQTDRLVSDDLNGRSSFGQTLAVQGARLYVGAPGLNPGGAVFVFAKGESHWWNELERIEVGQPGEDERPVRGVGSSVAASGNGLLVAARTGVVTAFEMETEATVQFIEPPDERSSNGFGVGLAMHGEVAVIGSPGADYEEGIATVYERDATTGAWQPTSTLVSEVDHYDSISGEQVDCEEGTAAVFGCDQVDLVSFVSASELSDSRGVKMTDIWGWEDPQTGKEYVLQARTDGTAFVDISDPLHPVYVGQLMRTEGSPGSAWRDVKVYKDHAFIVADGAQAHGVQIFDLTQLRDVPAADMPVTFEETTHYSGTHSTHNIVINEETGFAYAVGNRSGGETCGGQLHMIDIRDPKNPKFAGCFTHPDAGGTHDSQCVVYHGRDADYQGQEICFNSNGSSFIIANVTDKENPTTLAHATYPNLAYTHQGWLSEDHSYFYMNDELDELSGGVPQTRTLIWDVQDLDDPLLVKEFMLDTKASDHNLYVRGNFMYQSNYQSGLRILDISDPVNPQIVGYFDTVPGKDEPGFGGSWSNYPYFKSGIIAVSSRGEGLFLVKKREVDM